MLLNKNNFRVVSSVTILLVVSFTVTGFISTVYRREKASLGESHYQLGQRLEKRGDTEAAVEEYRKALLYSPDKQEYAYSFAASLVSAGRLDEAESHLDQLLQADPTNGALNLMRGRIAEQRKQFTRAIDFYERAVYEYWPPARAEDRRQARWQLIHLLDQTGRRDELVAELMTMYANAPNDVGLRLRIGRELLRRSATSDGLQVFRDLTRVAPRNAEGHEGLGEALMASGDYVSARHEFERAMRLDPKDRRSNDGLAQTNMMIDLSPEMASLTYAERFRRSTNLLKRVVSDLEGCEEDGTDDQVAAAHDLLANSSRSDPDAGLRMQTMAGQLWAARSRICTAGKTVNDPLAAMVLERLANE